MQVGRPANKTMVVECMILVVLDEYGCDIYELKANGYMFRPYDISEVEALPTVGTR